MFGCLVIVPRQLLLLGAAFSQLNMPAEYMKFHNRYYFILLPGTDAIEYSDELELKILLTLRSLPRLRFGCIAEA